MNPRRRLAPHVSVVVLGLLLIAAAGCGGKKGTSAPAPTPTAKVNGLVRDALTGNPLMGVTVKPSVGATATTDAEGRFLVVVPINQRVRIDVTRNDYSLNQLVVQYPSIGDRAVTVDLVQAGTTAAIVPATGGAVTDAASGARLGLPADFVTASGPVNVRVTGLDPTTDAIRALPGGLDAVDANGNAVYLSPVSFAEYTVTDANGSVLQFNPAATAGADIELPIPASLQGLPGYQNGDPIECYVYDPADGKWKTPVPGVIGPSTVNGQPAIKATIFHLSWYGGAPASNEVGCVQGTVRLNGDPVANVDVEAFPGSTARTDATGHFQVQAAVGRDVRVVASLYNGTTFRSAEGTVHVTLAGGPCALLDLALGGETAGQYTVEASINSVSAPAPGPSRRGTITVYDLASASLHVVAGSTQAPVTGATVQVGTGGTWFTLEDNGSGSYSLFSGQAGFVLVPGESYTLRVDFTSNGSFDATSQLVMAGPPVITSPANGATVGASFTATWTDAAHGAAGYTPIYLGGTSSDTLTQTFITRALSKVIGDGVTDPVTYLPNEPLPANDYEFTLNAGDGPLFDALLDWTAYVPNVTGTNVTGHFHVLAIGPEIGFHSNGTSNRLAAGPAGVKRSGPRANHVRASLAEIRRVQDRVRQQVLAGLRAQR